METLLLCRDCRQHNMKIARSFYAQWFSLDATLFVTIFLGAILRLRKRVRVVTGCVTFDPGPPGAHSLALPSVRHDSPREQVASDVEGRARRHRRPDRHAPWRRDGERRRRQPAKWRAEGVADGAGVAGVAQE